MIQINNWLRLDEQSHIVYGSGRSLEDIRRALAEHIEAEKPVGGAWCDKEKPVRARTPQKAYSPTWEEVNLLLHCFAGDRKEWIREDEGRKKQLQKETSPEESPTGSGF